MVTKKSRSSTKTKRPDRSSKATKSTKSAVPARAKTKKTSAEDLSGLKPKETRVEIKPAKGRPMLTWVGKKPLRHAIAYPAQLVETFNAQSKIVNRKSEICNRQSSRTRGSACPATGVGYHAVASAVFVMGRVLLANRH